MRGVGAGPQRAGQRQRARPLVRRQVPVAAGQCQSVRFADGRHAHDVHRQVDVAHHGADEGELLVVFLAEVRRVGAGQVQQLEDDGQYPVEEARTAGPLQRLAERPGVDPDRGLPGRVHLRACRGEHQVDTFGAGGGEVGLERARVPVEVLVRPELQRVHEQRHDHRVGRGPGGP